MRKHQHYIVMSTLYFYIMWLSSIFFVLVVIFFGALFHNQRSLDHKSIFFPFMSSAEAQQWLA